MREVDTLSYIFTESDFFFYIISHTSHEVQIEIEFIENYEYIYEILSNSKVFFMSKFC